MNLGLGARWTAFVLLGVTVVSATGCDSRERSSSAPTTTASTAAPAGGSQARSELTCDAPPENVLAWAKEALVPHPGPVRASTMVRAATTDTGQWYVIGIDREYELDDGTPTGDGSRSLAVTNAPDKPRDEARMIPIGDGSMGGTPTFSWDSVSWTGDALKAGQQAAVKAVACLDAESS